MHKYYMTQRGFSIGAQPMKNLVDHGDYDRKTTVLPGVAAWSWLKYSEPLTDAEIAAYELEPDPDNPDAALPFN